ncbi:hypothetical protein OG349_16255 [Streptomyces sp. NBC_01317]|uniref:hypothetical protein n=1 Tax=Streptomyces sp. NBC_01317 TaxID=2903822 RepID=UPI002E11280B|nr:hypothetical protein OG349_16255 [Streptomyces sp. NBC_01317]
MAYADFSAALSAPAHPPANPGYGKRCAPDQCPRGEADFVHLRTREAAIAAYIDRLPEGAAIGYKALAANIADYGQQACGKALNFLSDAGHLRRVKEHLQLEDNSFRWVTHTYFSRTSRDDAWWTAFVQRLHGVDLTELERRKRAAEAVVAGAVEAVARAGEGAEDLPVQPARVEPAPANAQPAAVSVPPRSVPGRTATAPGPAPSEAYRILARLGRTEPRMTLSARECAALESLAAEWLARGATPDHLVRSLTAGLPQPLRSPGAIARTRLENKMPPEPFHAPAHVNLAVMVCMTCDVADNVKPLIRGVCVDCREEMAAYDAAEDAGVVIDRVPDTFLAVPAQVNVARRADECRAMAGFKARPIPQQTHVNLGRLGPQ